MLQEGRALRLHLTVWNKCTYMRGLWSFLIYKLLGRALTETTALWSQLWLLKKESTAHLWIIYSSVIILVRKTNQEMKHWAKFEVCVRIIGMQCRVCSWEVCNRTIISLNIVLIRLISSCIDVCWRKQAELAYCSTKLWQPLHLSFTCGCD